jgi:hypothetical protein
MKVTGSHEILLMISRTEWSHSWNDSKLHYHLARHFMILWMTGLVLPALLTHCLVLN